MRKVICTSWTVAGENSFLLLKHIARSRINMQMIQFENIGYLLKSFEFPHINPIWSYQRLWWCGVNQEQLLSIVYEGNLVSLDTAGLKDDNNAAYLWINCDKIVLFYFLEPDQVWLFCFFLRTMHSNCPLVQALPMATQQPCHSCKYQWAEKTGSASTAQPSEFWSPLDSFWPGQQPATPDLSPRGSVLGSSS